MRIILAAVLIAAVLATHPVNQRLVNSINSQNLSWKAKAPEENPFAQMSVEEIKSMLGTHIVPTPEVLSTFSEVENLEQVPTSWDWRTGAKAQCAFAVRDQGRCGSCWAFGAAGALSHRFCLGGQQVQLSEQELVDCDRSLNMGCNGGYIFAVWNYLESRGLVTDDCYPYYSGEAGDDKKSCKSKCHDDKEFGEKHKCAGKSIHPTTPDNIRKEVYTNGATELAFTVYQDFMNYESGVYKHTTGSQLGGHAVMLIGYGTENGLDYWLCQNSWGPRWGDNGYFKIAVGDCGSNGQIYSCNAKIHEKSLESF